MASLNSRASVSATLERISSTGDDVSRILNQGGNIDTAIDLLRAAIENLTRINRRGHGARKSEIPRGLHTPARTSAYRL